MPFSLGAYFAQRELLSEPLLLSKIKLIELFLRLLNTSQNMQAIQCHFNIALLRFYNWKLLNNTKPIEISNAIRRLNAKVTYIQRILCNSLHKEQTSSNSENFHIFVATINLLIVISNKFCYTIVKRVLYLVRFKKAKISILTHFSELIRCILKTRLACWQRVYT